VLEALFGTPDDPRVPPAVSVGDEKTWKLDIAKIRLAAGPAVANKDGNTGGLYRLHCVHCHGVTGDGAGPTAEFLNPYPRDFRHGNFKFKTTEIGEKPSDEDLYKTLYNGINGTAMPSFKLLSQSELEALVEYVKYLAVRGEMEKALLTEKYEDLVAVSADSQKKGAEGEAELRTFLLDETLGEPIASRWHRAAERIVALAPRPDVPLDESIKKGRALFYSKANCFSCHGDSALGDGQIFYTNEPVKYPQIKPLVNQTFPPQLVRPRNLRYAAIRGSRLDRDVYRRISKGIDAVGMPAVPRGELGITEEEIWHLVDYVLSLPYEPEMLKQPAAENTRSN
jgi:mono/diheme cytochrome c family protein